MINTSCGCKIFVVSTLPTFALKRVHLLLLSTHLNFIHGKNNILKNYNNLILTGNVERAFEL